jgi:hypothetical protein
MGFAQNKTIEDIENAGKTVEKTNEAVEKAGKLIESIFGKKKKNKASENTSENIPDNTTENTKTVQKTEQTKSSPTNSNNLKVGSIHPNAVVLDVDELHPFYNGAAIVRKGSATALINAKGEFIVPFNKYKFNTNSKNGFFIVTSYDKVNPSVGFITSKGEYINTKGYPAIWEEYLIASDNTTIGTGNSIHYIYTITGKKHRITGDIRAIDTRIGNGLIPFGTTGKVGFKNLEDKIVINPIYLSVDPFYEGIAIVSKQNEFGEIKYSYIDTKGNPITPIQFSRKPLPFSDGLGLVYYSFNERLKYSYMNKKGEIIFTENNKDQFGSYYLGYAQKLILGTSKSFIIDTNMKQKTVSEFLNDFGIEPKNNSGSVTFPISKPDHNVSYHIPILPFRFYNGQKTQLGYLFTESKTAVYGDFENADHKNGFIWDNVSGLNHAKWKKSNMSGDVIDGYINQDGVFMIVKAEAPKW